MNKRWTPTQNLIYDKAPQHGECTCEDCKEYWQHFPKHPWFAEVFKPYDKNSERPF